MELRDRWLEDSLGMTALYLCMANFQKSRSLVIHPHEDMRVNFLGMTALGFAAEVPILARER